MEDDEHPRALGRRAALSWGAELVVPSKTLYRVASNVWRVPPDRLHHIPNGVEIDRFARPACAETLSRLGIAPTDIVVGNVAPLVTGCDALRLLRAASHLPGTTKLLLVGHCPERAEIERAAASLGLAGRIVFTGRLRRPELVLERFDLFVLTAGTTQMPYSLMEAMAAGRPVVAPAVRDVPDMVAPSNRPFIVPPRDGMAVARAMGELLSSRGTS